MPEVPERTLRDPSNNPHLNVTDMFRAEQRKALDSLQKRLRRFYDSEVQKFRLEQQQAIVGKEQVAYQEANNQIRVVFEKWAEERAPKFARLALVAGFPDPNPTSQPPSKPARPLDAEHSQTAKELRVDLKNIDARFHLDCNKILGAVLDKSSADQAELELSIEAFATELDKKAEQEARAQIRNAGSQMEFQLSEPAPISFPESPRHSIQISTESPLEPAPQVPSSGILEGVADQRRRVESELRIWAALKRYQIAQTPKGARDATQEFQLWRQQYGSGP
jgi:hypothetical protein